MRLLKGMMACLAALFFLGYVNSCESESSQQLADTSAPTEETVNK